MIHPTETEILHSSQTLVIPAKAGIHQTWVLALAGAVTIVTFRPMSGGTIHAVLAPWLEIT